MIYFNTYKCLFLGGHFARYHSNFSRSPLRKPTPFKEFRNKFPFDKWKYEVKTQFPDSTDESIKRAYKSHIKNLYKLHKVSCQLLEYVKKKTQ